jgi:dolichol-phosphate mannosyltransferase
MKISIIIPTFNEVENIEKLIKRIFKVSKKLNIEVIVVDDNSPDGTPEAVMLLSKKYKVKLLKRPRKMGLTSAVLDGMKLAKGNIIGVMDADFMHPVEKIPELVNAIKDNDIVIGSRFIKGGRVVNRSTFRSIISWGARTIARVFLDLKIKDPIAGFFFCKREIIKKTKFEAVGFKLLLSILVKNKNKKVKEIPINHIERIKGKSKLSFEEIINYIRTILRLMTAN